MHSSSHYTSSFTRRESARGRRRPRDGKEPTERGREREAERHRESGGDRKMEAADGDKQQENEPLIRFNISFGKDSTIKRRIRYVSIKKGHKL